MDKPSESLFEVTRTYNAARKAFTNDVRDYINVADILEPDVFWVFVDCFATEFINQLQRGNGGTVKSAIHNTLCRLDRPEPLGVWLYAVKFLRLYIQMTRELSNKCWDMPGVSKGDDSYGDWMDALPLAGKAVFEGIMNDDIANYKQVTKAVTEHRPELLDVIMHGENYIQMRFEEKLIERFGHEVSALDNTDDR